MGIDATEQHDISGSRGEAHLVWKCKMCKREHTICELFLRSTRLAFDGLIVPCLDAFSFRRVFLSRKGSLHVRRL